MFENGRENNRREAVRICRADICLAAFFLLLALGSFVWAVMSRKDGQILRLYCDGQMIVNAPLSQNPPQKTTGVDKEAVRYCLLRYSAEGVSFEWYEERPDIALAVPEETGYNLVAVGGERVWMEAADCRDQICVHHIPITGGGESIICLPHKLVVEIAGGTDGESVDGIAETESAETMAWNERRRQL